MSDGEESKSGYEKDETSEEEVVIEASEVGEMPAELLEEEVAAEVVEEVSATEDIVALNEDGTAVDQYDAETLDHVGSESVAEEPEETEPKTSPESEEEPVVRSATDEEEAAEAELAASEAAPNEPDPPKEQSGPQDPEGIVTALSVEAFAKLTEVWNSRGGPHQFDYQGARWAVYDNGEKFIRTGGQGSMSQFYNSLSIG